MVRFHCEQCYLSFSRADYLRGHIRALHAGELIKCNQCVYKTKTKTNLKAHLRSKHGAEKLRCDMCDFQSASTCEIIGHKKRIHKDKKYYCNQCDYTNINRSLLKIHIERMHSMTKNIKCDQCKYETSVKINLKTHIKYNHDTIQIKCNLCNFSGNRTVLWNHKKNRHSDLKQCTDCDYRTRKTASMVDHQRVKHQGLYLDCEECDVKFSTKVGLKTHKAIPVTDAPTSGTPQEA